MKKMWEGRFSEASSELLEKFNASIKFDKNLYLLDSIDDDSALNIISILSKIFIFNLKNCLTLR